MTLTTPTISRLGARNLSSFHAKVSVRGIYNYLWLNTGYGYTGSFDSQDDLDQRRQQYFIDLAEYRSLISEMEIPILTTVSDGSGDINPFAIGPRTRTVIASGEPWPGDAFQRIDRNSGQSASVVKIRADYDAGFSSSELDATQGMVLLISSIGDRVRPQNKESMIEALEPSRLKRQSGAKIFFFALSGLTEWIGLTTRFIREILRPLISVTTT